LLRRLKDSEHDTFQILHHVIIGESKHAISAGRKPFIAAIVVANTLFKIVTFTVDFDDGLAGVRDEVGDVTADWTLSTKSEESKPMSFQMTPHQRFGARHWPS